MDNNDRGRRRSTVTGSAAGGGRRSTVTGSAAGGGRRTEYPSAAGSRARTAPPSDGRARSASGSSSTSVSGGRRSEPPYAGRAVSSPKPIGRSSSSRSGSGSGYGSGSGRRGGRKKSFFKRIGDFFSSNIKIVIIAAGVLFAAALALIAVFVVLPAVMEANAPAEPVYVEPSAPVATPEPEPTPTPVPEKPIVSIGIIIGEQGTEIMDGFGEYAQELISSQAGLDKYYIYTSGTEASQQIQDTRSIINKGCKVLVAVGLNADTADIVAGLCEKAGVTVIGVESASPGRFAAEIKSAPAWFEGYSSSVKLGMPEGGKLLLISDEKKSDFSLGIKDALTAISVTPEDEIYYSPMTKAGLNKALEKAFKKKPDAMIIRGNRAVDFLTRSAKADCIPATVISRATVGLVKTWILLKGEGLITVEAVVPEAGDTKTEAVEEVRAFAPESQLFAYAGLDGTMTGKTACRFAFNLAIGKTLANGYTEYTVASTDMITNENCAEYFEVYKDAADELNIPGHVDIEAIDALFTDAPAAEDTEGTEAGDGV